MVSALYMSIPGLNSDDQMKGVDIIIIKMLIIHGLASPLPLPTSTLLPTSLNIAKPSNPLR